MNAKNTKTSPPGMSADMVIDAAVELTRQSHLYRWSIRDLARQLGVGPSTIYHHVGGKDLLCLKVVERISESFPYPDPHLDWKQWFRDLLSSLGSLLTQYPGTAKWLLLHGPNTHAVIPILSAGMKKLTDAGFAEHSNIAYAILINNPVLSLSLGDDRLLHDDDGPRDHASMMRDMQHMLHGHPDLSPFMDAMVKPFAIGGQTAAQARMEYFRFCIEVTIAGLETFLNTNRSKFPAMTG